MFTVPRSIGAVQPTSNVTSPPAPALGLLCTASPGVTSRNPCPGNSRNTPLLYACRYNPAGPGEGTFTMIRTCCPGITSGGSTVTETMGMRPPV